MRLTPSTIAFVHLTCLGVLTSCTGQRVEELVPPNRYTFVANDVMISHGWCRTRAECSAKGLVRTIRFTDSDESIANSGFALDVYGVAYDIGDEIANAMISAVDENSPCITIRVHLGDPASEKLMSIHTSSDQLPPEHTVCPRRA
jgi:hypothetical protein